MNDKLRRIAKWILYPLFYLFCLAIFGYLTFPFDRLKDRIIAEFERSQTKRGQTAAAQRLEIDEVTSYWFTGVEATGVRLIVPPDEASSRPAGLEASLGKGAAEQPKEMIIAIDEAHARVRILPLLIGRVKIDFTAKAFGGEISGTVPVGAASGPVELELENVDLGQIHPIVSLVGLPMKGTAQGKLELTASEGKFNKANGSLDFTIAGVSVGDGKTKLKGQIALPEARLGDVSIAAEATNGVLKLTKLTGTGPDIELVGDGKVSVREPWNDSAADLYIRFKFSDAYRDKNDDTRSLLGTPGSSMPALIEVVEPKVKKAKRADGFYGFHAHGPLKKLKFDPSATDAGGAKPAKKGSDSPFSAPKKPAASPPREPAAPKDDGEPAAPAPAPPRDQPAPEPAAPGPEKAPEQPAPPSRSERAPEGAAE
jgi:type II secretion system protein N